MNNQQLAVGDALQDDLAEKYTGTNPSVRICVAASALLNRGMTSRLASVLLFILCNVVGLAQPSLAGFSTTVGMSTDGVWVYLFVDGSAGPRSVLISAAGPGFGSSSPNRYVSDPQIELLDASGNRLAYNDDRPDSLLSDPSLPSYARGTKDAAMRVSLATGTYAVKISGVGGATGAVGIDVVDSSTRPGIASFALRARNELNTTIVRPRVVGTGNMGVAMFLSGPNLPSTNTLVDPRLQVSIGTLALTANDLPGSFASLATRFRSPVTGDSANAGSATTYSYQGNEAFIVTVSDQAQSSGALFLLEVHNYDNTSRRAPVVYFPPQSTTVASGAAATLRSLVGGDESTVVRFERDGVDLGEYSNGQFTIGAAGSSLAGSYRVRATNSSGYALSSSALLTVTPPPPFISVSPISTVINDGVAITLSATVSGVGLSYQWLKNGVPIAGATSASLLLDNVHESDSGLYQLRATNSGGTATSLPGTITVLPPDLGRLTNLSVRSQAGTGDRTLIVGFTLAGSAAKPMVVRGVGPGLAAFGLSGTIPDPSISLFVGTNQIAANDNWMRDDGSQLGAFPLALGSKDAVLIENLSAQSFTAQLNGVGGVTGETLVEVYDGNVGNTALRLVNLSTRTQLDNGQRLIVGFTVRGRTLARLLLRAVGPTLGAFGVASAHPDPRIELYANDSLLSQNDQWSGDDGRGAGAFPLVAGSKDAAMVVQLPAGSYSVHALGASGTSGVVLVEVYEW